MDERIDGRIILLILFVVISGVKWFIENVKNRGQQPHETSESLEEIYDDFREEIRKRQTEVTHPQERQVEERHPQDIFTPHHHEFGQQSPPPLPSEPTEIEYKPEPAPQPRKIRKPQLSLQEKAALANLKKQSLATKRSQRSHTTPSLRQLLSSPQAARQAIVLHEILGKPRSMQSGSPNGSTSCRAR